MPNTTSFTVPRSDPAADDPLLEDITDSTVHLQPKQLGQSRLVWLAVWGTITIASVVLVGWVFDIRALKVVVPGLVSMKINTAVGFILLAISLRLVGMREQSTWKLVIAYGAALVAMVIGGVALAERLFSWDAGIDELFAKDLHNPDPYPGRPSPATALNFCLLGCALLLYRTRHRVPMWVAQAAIIVAFLMSALALVSYLYGASALHGMYPFSSMALHTAGTFVLLTVGMLCWNENFAVMTPLHSEGAGGFLARRMIPTIVCVSLIAGWLRLQGQRRDLLPLEFALALHCVVSIAVFCMAIWWVSRLLDRTDVKRLQAEAALEKNRAELAHVLRINTMGEMVAGIAHELNQPLAAIGNFARGTIRRLQSGQGKQDELIEAVQTIASESTRAADIILSLKRYIQDCSPQRQPFDINQIVQDASRILAGEAEQRGVRVTLHCDPTLPQIRIDHVQIKQVVINLICNGFDALDETSGPKSIRLETRHSIDGYIEVIVTDNGCGLPQEHRHRIFDAFYTTKPHGLGMGLAISRSIVVAHDGNLWADTCAGATNVCFSLPTASTI